MAKQYKNLIAVGG